jgi:hypothetical protein
MERKSTDNSILWGQNQLHKITVDWTRKRNRIKYDFDVGYPDVSYYKDTDMESSPTQLFVL